MLEEWERLIPELRAGSFDAVATSMSITEKRRQVVSFTDRYYNNVARFVTRKGSGFDPADAASKTIGAARATIASDWLDANLAGTATIKLYAGQQELYGDLVSGRLDAIFGDGLGSYAWPQGPKGAGFEFVGRASSFLKYAKRRLRRTAIALPWEKTPARRVTARLLFGSRIRRRSASQPVDFLEF